MKSTAGLLPQIICRYRILFIKAVLQRTKPWPSLKKSQNCKGFIHGSFFPLYLFSLMSLVPFLLSSIEVAVRNINFGWVYTKPSRHQAILWRLRLTENLDDARYESSLFTIGFFFFLISNSLDNCYVPMVFRGTLLEVMEVKLPYWFFSVVELKYLSGKLSAHLQPT